MKKIIFIVLVFCIACSPSENSENTEDAFNVSITQDATTVVIDQMVTFKATVSEPINTISFSTDGGATFAGEYSTTFGNTANLYLDFDTVGTKSIVFRIKNSNGDIVDSPLTVKVDKGNAIQLQSLQLNSFFNKGNTWDAEFGDTDPKRLADVIFGILKPKLDVFKGTRSNTPNSSWVWYKSETRENEVNLNWDLQNEALFINIDQLIPWIAFVDDDGGGIAQDLMMGPPYERVIPITDFLDTKPNSILVKETDINLEYELGIGW